jgi:hypothetical protein
MARAVQRFLLMRLFIIGFALVGATIVGCASPEQLRDRAEIHAQLASGAYFHGDKKLAMKEQAKAQRLYESAAVRAWLTRQPVPEPPATPPVAPVAQW